MVLFYLLKVSITTINVGGLEKVTGNFLDNALLENKSTTRYQMHKVNQWRPTQEFT